MHRWLPLGLILVLLIAFRALGSAFPHHLPNFNPLPALLLCSLVFLSGWQRWALPLSVWLITDPLTSSLQGYPVLGPHHASLALGVLAIIGFSLWTRRRPSAGRLLAAAGASALSFYFLTNLLSFAFDPLYPKSLAGFVQAQWTGPAGFGPTWIFLRNLLAANLLFSALFLAAGFRLPGLAPRPLPQPAR
jgi:uncharacterized membrane protein YeiB